MGKFKSVYNSTAGEADEIKSYMWASQALQSTTGSLHVLLQNTSIAVTATDLDIRDLQFAQDSVDVSGSSVSISGSVTVTATDLDIRDLAFASDSVDVSGSSVSISGTVTTTSAAPSNFDVLSKAVSTSAALYTSPSGQVKVHIMNNGNQDIAIGNSGVTFSGTPATDGYIVSPGAEVVIELSNAAAIHAVAKAGTQDVRVLALIA